MQHKKEIKSLIKQALGEDIGSGDLTVKALSLRNKAGPARIISRQSGILCGLEVVRICFRMQNPLIEIESIKDAANDAVTLASRTVAPEGSKTFKPLSSNRVEIPLNDTPPFEKLIENGYPQKNYRVDFLAHTGGATGQIDAADLFL